MDSVSPTVAIVGPYSRDLNNGGAEIELLQFLRVDQPVDGVPRGAEGASPEPVR